VANRDLEVSMRMFVAFVIVLGIVYLWDAEYNYGKLADGIFSMGRAIGHSMGW
jgi:hypothetical protein